MNDDETATTTIAARVPVALMVRLDAWAETQRRSRANAMAFLIERGLDLELVREAAAGAGAVVK